MEGLIGKEHKIILTDRNQMQITGVEKANGLNENLISLLVTGAHLIITGKNMHVEKLMVEEGIVELEGDIESIKYSQSKPKTSFIKRLFK